MKIFIDSSDTYEIEKWDRQGIVDGITTNPSIMLKDGSFDMEETIRRVCTLMGERPVSTEVTTNDHDEMLRQARQFSSWAANVVVKIPVVNECGESSLRVICTLNREGIRVNATAILAFNQAMLAVKAGATYVSIFAGRIADEGGDAIAVIRNVRHWLDEWGFRSEVIVGSMRGPIDIQNAVLAGAHIVTVPPQFLPKMIDHKYTRETVRQFNRDAEKAISQFSEARSGGNGAAQR